MFDCSLFNLVIIADSELHKVHDYSVFDYFLFNLVTISDSEFYKVLDYCVFDCFLFNLVTISGGKLHKLLDNIVCLSVFSLILSQFQRVSYIKCMNIV